MIKGYCKTHYDIGDNSMPWPTTFASVPRKGELIASPFSIAYARVLNVMHATEDKEPVIIVFIEVIDHINS